MIKCQKNKIELDESSQMMDLSNFLTKKYGEKSNKERIQVVYQEELLLV